MVAASVTQSNQFFDFNERGTKLNFTPLHLAVLQNNFILIPLLLNYSRDDIQALDLMQPDSEGRIAIELSHGVSSIHKTLKRALFLQQKRLVDRRVKELETNQSISS